MLRQTLNSHGIQFVVNYNDSDLPFQEWKDTDDCIYYFSLSSLVDNGYASVNEDGCLVPFENIYILDDEERMLLGIPNMYDKELQLRGEGMLNTSDFKYKLEFLSHVPDGFLYKIERTENIISFNEQSYLLSEAQYCLVKKVDEFNITEENIKTADYNLRKFAEIKELAKIAGCHLDSYLNNENVFVPQRIKLEVGSDETGFTLEPSINIPENDKFQYYFEKGRKVQAQYPLQNDKGERVRVVLNSMQKKSLEQLKSTGGKHKSREQIREYTEKPTEYFDPDIFDLSELYSDRVIEIGLYKPKFYPFVCPYKSNWIAGATVETPEDGTSRITINSEQDLENLKQCIITSKENNKDIVEYNNTQMDIKDAIFLAETAEKQLKNPK